MIDWVDQASKRMARMNWLSVYLKAVMRGDEVRVPRSGRMLKYVYARLKRRRHDT